ncbi:hypothetical protein Bbelb_309800 [Branchiostoma belcheri]|nr:hypothetical protein Bbelb_309800 [Branchiostoma belcheri]
MSGTPMSEDISSTTDTRRDENNEIYQPEDNPHWSTILLETQELSTLYTEDSDSAAISTSPGNVSGIDEESSVAEATDIADNAEPVYHNPEDNSNSGPSIDASDPEDIDRAPTGSLDDTITNPHNGDVVVSDNIDIQPYAVSCENLNNTISDKTSNEPNTKDTKKREMTNPMYEELPDDKNLQRLQSQPTMKALQENMTYGGYNPPNQWAGDESPIYRYCWLIAFVVFLIMVGLITAGIMAGMYHYTQNHGSPTKVMFGR